MGTIEEERAVIRIENVVKEYIIGEKGFLALKDVNLTVIKGELLAIVGKSGSGKSTLLNLLGGIDKPTTGKIIINENEISSMGENRLSRFRGENIGFVFQFFQLMPTLTVLENIIMPMDFLRKIPANKRKERALMLLSKVGVSDQAYKFPSSLSGGQQQRVAIARALSNDPKIILADEPTGNLDSRSTREVMKYFAHINNEVGTSILMVTHDTFAASYCNRAVLLKDGEFAVEIKKTGSRKEFLDSITEMLAVIGGDQDDVL